MEGKRRWRFKEGVKYGVFSKRAGEGGGGIDRNGER
jgi:hypothetical protein